MGLLEQINQEAAKSDLQFLVIGGLAVNLYGYSRDTADIDLLIELEARDQWLQLFSGLSYTMFHDAKVFVQLAPPREGAWPVDLMLVRQPTFRQMLAAAVRQELCNVSILVPKLEHLLALKLHTLVHGRIHRYLKDYLDVENLVRINRVNMKSENIRQLFQKYGTMELYEKISRTAAIE